MEKEKGMQKQHTSSIQQHEDAILKISAKFFQDEILPHLGIEGKVTSVAPTEIVQLDLKKMYQDFNYIMEDGSWKHFEFQSTDGGVKDMKRFRVYEAQISYQYDVDVTTYVLYSGKIKNPTVELKTGMNAYKVYPIVMSDRNADEVIQRLQKKVANDEVIEKDDLLALVLCPLMGGKSSQKERVKFAYQITRHIVTEEVETIKKVEAMIYAMADKFLEVADMEEIRREIAMTRLGQMIYDDGKEEGIAQEMNRGIRVLIQTCKDLGVLKEEIVKKVSKEFEKTPEEAEKEVEKYWK